MNATNVVTDLSNIPNNQSHHHHHNHHHHHQHRYDSEQMRFDALSTPIADINNGSNNTTTAAHTTTVTTAAAAVASMVTANNSTNNSNGDALSNNEMTSSTSPPDGPLRHSSMDRLMSLLNEMGQTPRTRSISDGGQDEGKQYRREMKNKHFEHSLINSFS